MNPEKSKFCVAEVKYLGFIINNYGLQTDPSKVSAIELFPAPTNPRQVRRFIGMCSWYRSFVPNFAALVAPITKLVRQKVKWEWGSDQQEAFDKVKLCLMSAPVLDRPDFSRPFSLSTDASIIGLGAVLEQYDENGNKYAIAYASRILHGAEVNYTISELECLAVIWATEKFRCYVEGRSFTVYTDHSCLRWLQNIRNPAGRLARWAMKLLAHDITIVHRKGTQNHLPDALSRMYEMENPITTALQAIVTKSKFDWYTKRISDVNAHPKRFPNWKVVDDKLYYRSVENVEDDITRDDSEWKLVVPESNRSEVLAEAHDDTQAAHGGVDKTLSRLSTRYFWPGIYKDVFQYVRKCETCQKIKVSQQKQVGLLGQRFIDEPWSVVASDIMGPLPRSKTGMCYLLVIQDLFTKWIELQPLRDANGPNIRAAIEELVLSRWGTPRVLLTDNGTEFKNKVITDFAEECGMVFTTIPPYRPQADPVERTNRVVKTMIMAYIEQDHRDWDKHLSDFRFAYNTACHASTKMTPAFLNFGRNPEPKKSWRRAAEGVSDIKPVDPKIWSERMRRLQNIRAWVTENIIQAHERQALHYNAKRRHLAYDVGDSVYVRNRVLSDAVKKFSAKLAPKFKGPYVIKRVASPLVYYVTGEKNKEVKVYVSDLKIHTRAKRTPT